MFFTVTKATGRDKPGARCPAHAPCPSSLPGRVKVERVLSFRSTGLNGNTRGWGEVSTDPSQTHLLKAYPEVA